MPNKKMDIMADSGISSHPVINSSYMASGSSNNHMLKKRAVCHVYTKGTGDEKIHSSAPILLPMCTSD
jgi:hypothetical protein